jgi:hypothetical protein
MVVPVGFSAILARLGSSWLILALVLSCQTWVASHIDNVANIYFIFISPSLCYQKDFKQPKA